MKHRFVAVAGLILAPVVGAQAIQRVSISTNGVQANGQSTNPSINPDGRFVAFESTASNMASGDHGHFPDVFVRDRALGITEWESHSPIGLPAGGYYPSISADGRYVSFGSGATDLVPGDTNGFQDVFVRDRQAGTTVLVSVSTGGTQGNDYSYPRVISADGRYVVFVSNASNLVAGDTNHVYDVFLHDLQAGTTELVDLGIGGAEADYGASWPAVSADGRFVAFVSSASNLVPNNVSGYYNVFVRDRQLAVTELVSISTSGTGGDLDSLTPEISADGRFVAFYSRATNLIAGDTNGFGDVYVRDRQTGATERVSVDSGGAQGNNQSGAFGLSISGDGLSVAFQSDATNLVPQDNNGWSDVFLRDRVAGTTRCLSTSTAGALGDNGSSQPSVSSDGRYVAMSSSASNLIPGDTNGYGDVFLRDREATSFTSRCNPGVDSVIDCPCSNWPTSLDRGCDNSSYTGGAGLEASGLAHLSADDLVLTTSGEKPTAFSIVLQGRSSVPNGLTYGQGVRCVGPPMVRLFTKHAVAGSITAPEFGAGDPTVSARSAAKGDVIQAGESRFYLVYYRDPIVLGGCPASSTFNATQTGQVTWWP